MAKDPKTIVEHYLKAIEEHDYDRARSHLADSGFSYKSPIATFSNADAFMQYTELSGGIVHRIEIRKAFVDADHVCHFLVFHIQISEKTAVDVVHWAEVRDGRIIRIESLFDAHLYRRMFDMPDM